MRRCAVIGSPIEHSLSPLLHRTAYHELGLASEFSYDAIEVTPATLSQFVAGLGPEWVGLSVTAPIKQALLSLGEADAIATALQAGNTLILGHHNSPNRIYNTDVTGMLAALARSGVTKATTAVLLGNGATARSALWALGSLGVQTVIAVARDATRALGSLYPVAELAGIELAVQPFGHALELPEAWGGQADLLISTVPVELPAQLASALASQARCVFEVVYNHYPSALSQAAERAGVLNLDGLDLLVGQAIDQIRLMTGREADPGPLLAACRAELAHRS